MILIDGSQGEGGGQVLRSSLGLSLVTGEPVRVRNIRASRPKSGLMRQHLAAVRAAATICNARVHGDSFGSREVELHPGAARPGEYEFSVGSAGSAALVLQTVLPPLMIAAAPSRLTLTGGTHNPWSPPFDFLVKSFLPLLDRMGPRVSARLVRPGFYPAGGGEFIVEITPAAAGLKPLELLERGELVSRRARAIVARLPRTIAERELAVVERQLGWAGDELAVEEVRDSAGPGNLLMLELASRHVTEVVTSFGRQGVPAETVAQQAVEEAQTYLAADVPVGPHLADQLLIPLAMAGGGRFRATAPTPHTTTNIAVIQQFLNVTISAHPTEQHWEINVKG